MAGHQDMWSCPEDAQFARFPQYASFPERLKTFGQILRDVPAKELACGGFYYSRDLFICYYCGFETSYDTFPHGFFEGEVSTIAAVHYAHSPLCLEAAGEDERRRMRESLEARIESFRGRPLENAPTPESMARAGFFLYFGRNPVVQCPFCRVRVWNWSSRENLLEYHAYLSPNCSFLAQAYQEEPRPPSRAISFGPLNYSSEPLYPQFRSTKDRFASFAFTWRGLMNSHSLAKAGFFWTGRHDIVQCFHCGGGLQHWRRDDSVMELLTQFYPNCYFVARLVRKLYDNILEDFPYYTEAIAMESANLIDVNTPDVPEAPDEHRMICLVCEETAVDVVCLPCCHAVCCVECAKTVPCCPVCRMDICRKAKIFL